ncbi:MAG: CinA family protein [Candidatus Rickettsia vulgarisii]
MIDEILLNLVEQLKKILIAKNFTISVAESCTGGLLTFCLTSIDGSSNYFSYGFITYSNQAKIDLLNVPLQIIDQFGAVSKETSESMAISDPYIKQIAL